MSHWIKSQLGQICTLKIGGTPSRSRAELWDEAKSGSNLWASIADLKQQRVSSTAEQITDLGVRLSSVKKVSAGTILMSFKLSVGRVAIAERDLFTNEAIVALESPKINRDFLFYGLQYWDLLAGVEVAVKGATLNKPKLKAIPVCYPESPAEQAKIAEVLAEVDHAIERTQVLAAKHERIKIGLMQDLLSRGLDSSGQLRDPSTCTFRDPPLGRIPAEWEVVTVNDIATYVGSGVTPTGGSDVYQSEGVLFIRSQNVYNDGLRLDDAAYISETIDKQMARSRVEPHDVLLNITGASIGRCCFAPSELRKANVNQHVCIIRQKGGTLADAFFLSMIIAGEIGQDHIRRFNAGGNREGLNFQQVRAFEIPFPQRKEREAIVDCISRFDRTVQSHKLQLAKLQRLKAGLMADLLSGRVPVAPLLESSHAPSTCSGPGDDSP